MIAVSTFVVSTFAQGRSSMLDPVVDDAVRPRGLHLRLGGYDNEMMG